MGENETALEKRDTASTLERVTGKSIDQLRLVAMTLLPKEMQGDMNALALYIMRCQQLSIDPFGAGAYPVIMKGKFQVLVHYGTLMAKAYDTGKVKALQSEAVYKGESFSYDPLTGDVKHEPKPADRHGIPVGAWARCERIDRPTVFVSYVTHEDSKRSTSEDSAWAKNAREMTRKAALKDVLRLAFPEILSGVYTREDFPDGTEPEHKTITIRIPASDNDRNRISRLAAERGKTGLEACGDLNFDWNNLTEDEAKTVIAELTKPEPQTDLFEGGKK